MVMKEYVLKRTFPKNGEEVKLDVKTLLERFYNTLDEETSKLNDYKGEVVFSLEGPEVKRFLDENDRYTMVNTLNPDYILFIRKSQEKLGPVHLDKIDPEEIKKAARELSEYGKKINKILRGIKAYQGNDRIESNDYSLAFYIAEGAVNVKKAFDFEKIDEKIERLRELKHELLE